MSQVATLANTISGVRMYMPKVIFMTDTWMWMALTAYSAASPSLPMPIVSGNATQKRSLLKKAIVMPCSMPTTAVQKRHGSLKQTKVRI